MTKNLIRNIKLEFDTKIYGGGGRYTLSWIEENIHLECMPSGISGLLEGYRYYWRYYKDGEPTSEEIDLIT